MPFTLVFDSYVEVLVLSYLGYGFLSENATFAGRCEKEGIVFIGPTSSTIECMGSKKGAKTLLKASAPSVPLIPGYNGDNQDVNHLMEEAIKIGFPVLIKASAGGGGKGMRIVYSKEQLKEAIDSAKSEASNSFGDDLLLIEKYFESVKHIEFQLFGDNYGNVIHLFERECSVQRRHQKVLEETPSVIMSPNLREKMGNAAITIGNIPSLDAVSHFNSFFRKVNWIFWGRHC
jgi:3-methylcrotonyl-CoA carboxylase alpha subunit